MQDKTAEMILHLGVEGGDVRFFRRLHSDVDFDYSFLVGSMVMTDDGEEGNSERHSTKFRTLEDAIRAFSSSRDWVYFHPVSVHRDYGATVWNLREREIEAIPSDEERDRLRARSKRWERLCNRNRSTKRSADPTNVQSNRMSFVGSIDRKILGAAIAIVEHLQKASMTAEEISTLQTAIFESIKKQLNSTEARSGRTSRIPRRRPPRDE